MVNTDILSSAFIPVVRCGTVLTRIEAAFVDRARHRANLAKSILFISCIFSAGVQPTVINDQLVCYKEVVSEQYRRRHRLSYALE